MSETWWVAGGWDGGPLRSVKVVRSSESSVWLDGKAKHVPRNGLRGHFFPTYAEARAYLIQNAERNLNQRIAEKERADKAIDFAVQEVQKFRAIPEGEPCPHCSSPMHDRGDGPECAACGEKGRGE